MRMPRSLQARVAVAIGLAVTILWIAAALITARRLGQEMDVVFDRGLQATAQRLLPLAREDRQEGHDEDDHRDREIGNLADYDEDVTYIVRDQRGRVLLRSDGAVDATFPPFDGVGFRQTETHRLYYDAARDRRVIIAVAEPLDRRAKTLRSMLLGMIVPLLVVIPLSLAAIMLVVRRGFRSVRLLQQGLARRGAQDLSALSDAGLPSELAPIAAGMNQLFARLRAAFDAERAFTANAAHELRTPVAGAIAQAQRLQSETSDSQASRRAAEIETTLKRLMRTSEKLMQLARAEGSRLQLDITADLRPILDVVVQDFLRSGEGRIVLSLPDAPVLSNLDPDAFGILCRNLIENALRHGDPERPVTVKLETRGLLSVCNEGPRLPPEAIERLMQPFERGSAAAEGSGLGLAIVKAITDRAGAQISVVSPRADQQTGVRVSVSFPVSQAH